MVAFNTTRLLILRDTTELRLQKATSLYKENKKFQQIGCAILSKRSVGF